VDLAPYTVAVVEIRAEWCRGHLRSGPRSRRGVLWADARRTTCWVQSVPCLSNSLPLSAPDVSRHRTIVGPVLA